MDYQRQIELGRKYANGDDVMIDLEKAYALWFPVENYLTGEDREIFLSLRKFYAQSTVFVDSCADPGVASAKEMLIRAASQSSVGMPAGMVSLMAAPKKKKPRTKEEARKLFDKLLAEANEEAVTAIYDVLDRYAKKKDKPAKVRKPENIMFGNNLGFIMHQFRWNRSVFLDKLNEKLKPLGDHKSSQTLTQTLNGEHGMTGSGQLKIVEMINEADLSYRTRFSKRILHREFRVEDLKLPLTKLVELFVSPRLDDERIRALLEAERETKHP